MKITQPTQEVPIGLNVVNPFTYLPTPSRDAAYRKFLKLRRTLGNEGISSFNISDTQNLIKQIRLSNGGYHGKDTIT